MIPQPFRKPSRYYYSESQGAYLRVNGKKLQVLDGYGATVAYDARAWFPDAESCCAVVVTEAHLLAQATRMKSSQVPSAVRQRLVGNL